MSVVLYCSFFPLLTFIFLLFPSQSSTDESNDVSRKVSNSHLWFLKRNLEYCPLSIVSYGLLKVKIFRINTENCICSKENP